MLGLTLPAPIPRTRRATGVLAATALILGMSAARANAGPVAYGSIDRLVQSTGNLYWTGHSFDGQHYQLSVWRTGKTANPGDERALWQENAGTSDRFGALTYANVAGTWYGYFIDNYWAGALGGPGTRVSVIKRVPLAGGAAVALRTTDNPFLAYTQLPGVVGQNDLVTDGSYLYWADSQAIRRMPIGGGSVSTLANGIALGHVALDDSYVYYTSGTTIRRVPKPGGASTILVSGYTVTALQVTPGATTGQPTTLSWAWGPSPAGQAFIESEMLGGATRLLYHTGTGGWRIPTFLTSGKHVFLSACLGSCSIEWWDPDPSSAVMDDGEFVTWDSLTPRDVLGDANAMYWADDSGIRRWTL
jgi:hypothetical protein